MKKQIFSVVLVSTLLTGQVYASTSSLQNQLNNVKNQSSAISNEIKDKKSEVSAINASIAELDAQINASIAKIADLENQIVVLNKYIEEAEAEIERLNDKIDVNNELLGERINVMYKQGDVAYVEILLNSRDFGELLSNFNMLTKIVEYDRNLLQELDTVKGDITTKKQELESNKTKVAELKKQVEAEKQTLEANQAKQEQNKAAISADIKKLELQEDQLLKEAKALESQIKAMTANSTMGTTYKGGVMGWPLTVSGRVTSEFGYRIHPIYGYRKMHTGIDIAAPGGTPVLAAADGVVIWSGYKGSYGNCVMIDHGGGIVTLYAHNSALTVGKGTKVSRGTVVAKVGSTGASTGNHLHFEVRKNGAYLNPRGYI